MFILNILEAFDSVRGLQFLNAKNESSQTSLSKILHLLYCNVMKLTLPLCQPWQYGKICTFDEVDDPSGGLILDDNAHSLPFAREINYFKDLVFLNVTLDTDSNGV